MRSRASDPEKSFISINYERDVTGNLEKAVEIAESWAQTYPRDVRAHTMSSMVLRVTGRYDRSVEEASKAIAVDPDFAFGYVSQALDYLILDHPEKANETIAAAWDRKLQPAQLILIRYYTAFLSGDTATMEQQVTLAQNRPDTEDWMTHCASSRGGLLGALATGTRAVEARRRLGRAGRQSRESGHIRGRSRNLRKHLGRRGRRPKSGKSCAEFIPRPRRRICRGVCAGQAWKYGESQKLANDLNRRFPEDTAVQYQYLPVLHALAALRTGRWKRPNRNSNLPSVMKPP